MKTLTTAKLHKVAVKIDYNIIIYYTNEALNDCYAKLCYVILSLIVLQNLLALYIPHALILVSHCCFAAQSGALT